jgi:DNA-3-methyladenine glycosylase I
MREIFALQRKTALSFLCDAAPPWWKSYESASLIGAPPVMMKSKEIVRCDWARTEPNLRYHDEEWGVPVHEDRTLFEFLILEGAQAGLSWTTILNKRENYRKAFAGFDPKRVARFDQRKIQALLHDTGIVRNELKIVSAVENAKAFIRVQKEFGNFDTYIWQFVGGSPRLNAIKTLKEVPAQTAESNAMSKDLKRRGFNFVGSTICYAFMQAVGIVNDHLVKCFRYKEIVQGQPPRAARQGKA